MRKKLCIAILILVMLFAFFICINFYKSYEASKAYTPHMFNIGQVEDGEYEGESDFGLVKVRVRVQIKQHKIKHIILLEHQNGKGSSAETILDNVVQKNTVEVDTISGATISSKAILQAIEHAFTKK